MESFINKAAFVLIFRSNQVSHSSIKSLKYLNEKVIELFSTIALIYGQEVFTLFSPVMKQFNHKVDDILKGNKYLLPHLVTGLIHGSYNWPKETREQLYKFCIPYYKTGFEVNDQKLYQMWESSLNYIIKQRDLNLYNNLLQKILENPFDTDLGITRRRRINRYSMI